MTLPSLKLDIDSKFLRKLLETTASGVGAVAGAWLKKRDAHATADTMRIEAQGRKDAEDILSGKKMLSINGGVISTSQQDTALLPAAIEENEIQSRLTFQEMKRQDNLKSIFERASQEEDGDASDEVVDPAWIAKFFTYAQDVSNDEMQLVWAKILSDEVKVPGSCSLRTLEVVKSLSRADALTFERVRPYLLGDFIPSANDALKEIGITLDAIIKLEDAGLIDAGFARSRTFINQDGDGKFIGYARISRDRILLVRHDMPEQKFVIDSYGLTGAGKELHAILPEVEPDLTLLKLALEKDIKKGFTFFVAKLGNQNEIDLAAARPL